jgi:hypothetical protein
MAKKFVFAAGSSRFNVNARPITPSPGSGCGWRKISEKISLFELTSAEAAVICSSR